MQVLLTGGTGFVGSAVLRELRGRGHEVTALVRSEASAAAVAAAGATPVQVDAYDVDALVAVLDRAEGAIHAAAPGDGTSEALDRAVVEAVTRAFGGTTRPFVHTSGVWKWGSGSATETSPTDPPAIVAWRVAVEELLLAQDVVASVVAPGVVYGGGRGIPALVSGAPRVDGPDGPGLALVGDGAQRWSVVHVDDLAVLYALALEHGARGHLLGTTAEHPTVRALTEAASRAAGLGGVVVPQSVEATRERFGAPFADALLLDQATRAVRAAELGWTPVRGSLVEELESGSYVPEAAARA